MQNASEWIKVVLAAIGGGLAWFFGPWDALISVLIGFIAVDYLMGVINAGMRKELSSEVGFKGLLRKMVILLLVGVGALLDKIMPGANGAIRAAVCTFYIANEGLSILENAGALGLPLPPKLLGVLKQLEEEMVDQKEAQ